MCYASPGPRCEGHAKEKYAKASEKSRQVVSDLLKVEKDIEKYTKENPDAIGNAKHKSMLKKKNKLQDDAVKFSRKTKEAREDLDSTRGGMNTLRDRIAAVNAGHGSAEDRADLATLHRRLELGRRDFKTKMDAYDAKNETVDGRSPSPYGDDEGIQTLTNRMKKIKAKYDASSSYGERNELHAKYHALNKARTHAVNTREHAKNGVINPYKASLKSNQGKLKKAQAEFKASQQHLQQSLADQEAIRSKLSEVRSSPSHYSEEEWTKIAQYETEMSRNYTKNIKPGYEAVTEGQQKVSVHWKNISLASKSRDEVIRI